GSLPHLADPRSRAALRIDGPLSDVVLENFRLLFLLYAWPADVARAGLSPQQAYTDLIRAMGSVYRSALEGARDAERRAQTIVSLCVGGMVLARTTNDPELRRSLPAAARSQALALLKGAA